jgi:hypothetical protein
MKKTIYVGAPNGDWHQWVEESNDYTSRQHDDAWWFPEIDLGHCGGAQARHPARIIKMVPGILRSPYRKIVTNSEHIILAIQQLIRKGQLGHREVSIFCGYREVVLDTDGDFIFWPGPFFNERLELLR